MVQTLISALECLVDKPQSPPACLYFSPTSPSAPHAFIIGKPRCQQVQDMLPLQPSVLLPVLGVYQQGQRGACVLFAKSCPTLCNPMDSWYSPGKNTGVGCNALLQGIFPTQGLNLGVPRCRQILYSLSHQGRDEGTPVSYKHK